MDWELGLCANPTNTEVKSAGPNTFVAYDSINDCYRVVGWTLVMDLDAYSKHT